MSVPASSIRAGRLYAGRDPRIHLPYPRSLQFRRVNRVTGPVVIYVVVDEDDGDDDGYMEGLTSLGDFSAWAEAEVVEAATNVNSN